MPRSVRRLDPAVEGNGHVGTWRCTTCQATVEGTPGEPTKDPKFRIGKCPSCEFVAAMFLRVK